MTSKSYLRDNVFDVYAQDDWRVLPSLTLLYGVRYEFFAPYTEKYGHLGEVLTNPAAGFTSETAVTSGGAGLPASLVDPYRTAFAPRLGMAWRVPKVKQMVVRGGYGMNYTVGAYATFATTMAHQPPFANEQTNQEADATGTPTSACARSTSATCLYAGERISGGGDDWELCARSAFQLALCAGLECRYSEEAAVGHCDERRVQRVEGKQSGHRDRAARPGEQPADQSDQFALSV